MKTKIYNIGAHGIPSALQQDISKLGTIPLTYTRHAMREALNDRYGTLPSRAFPTRFNLREDWLLVECEGILPGRADKFIVRKRVDEKRSLVLVIMRDGTVRTLWTNLNTDGHATLDKERFDKP